MNLYNKLHISIIAILLLIIAFFAPSTHARTAESYATESLLSSGKWVKVSVNESGIHAITASDAKRWGFSGINSLKVFG